MAGLTVEPLPPADLPSGNSLLDAIRADYADAKAKPHRLDLPVPMSKLGVRYKPTEDDLDVGEDASADERNFALLIAACDCIVIRDDVTGEWEPFEPYGEPLRYSAELADLMGWTTGSASDVVLEVFGKMPKPILGVRRHVIEVTRWMMGETQSAEEDMLGKS